MPSVTEVDSDGRSSDTPSDILFHVEERGLEGLGVVRSSGMRVASEDKAALVRDYHRYLDAELVWLMSLALGDTLDLGSVNTDDGSSSLLFELGEELLGDSEQVAELRLQRFFSFGFSGDIANNAAKVPA